MPTTPSKQPARIASMFDQVAHRYDRTNTFLTAGIDRWWRRQVREALELEPGQRVLDLAAGTAVSTEELARSGAYVVACDFSLGMLRQGQGRGVPLVAGDALHLPFADDAFDAVTISFGLRNVADPDAALREMARVTKPGGQLVVCEFSKPPSRMFRSMYFGYLRHVLPVMARPISSDPSAYVYLTDSIEAWPDQRGLAQLLVDTGWTNVAWSNLTGGIVALHRGKSPAN